jgi:hypothetical protein
MKLPMKLLRTAGLCLVAMFVMSMVATGTASAAAPVWEVCLTERSGSKTTKWNSSECTTAATGGSEWSEVKVTEPATSLGTLRLIDDNVPIEGEVEVICTVEEVGSVGPGKLSRTSEINIKCSPGKKCIEITKAAKPINLPWRGELEAVGTEVRNNIRAVNGNGAGWSVTCKTNVGTVEDECTSETGRTTLSRNNRFGPNGFRQLSVLLTFPPRAKSEDDKCKIGGAESGLVLGSISSFTHISLGGAGLRAGGL